MSLSILRHPSGSPVTTDDPEPPDKSEEAPKRDPSNREPPSGSLLPIPPEVLERIPPEQRNRLLEVFGMAFSGPAPHPLAQKVTSEHLAKLIEYQGRDIELDYKDRQDSRRNTLYGTAVAALFILILILGLAFGGHDALAIDIVRAGIFVAGGGGIGVGISEWRHRKDG